MTVLTLSFFFFQAEDGIRDGTVTGVQTCALPICPGPGRAGVDLPLHGKGWKYLRGLDKTGRQGQPGQVGAAAATGLVADPVQVRPDRADADVQLGGDLRVGMTLGDQGDQLPFPGAEPA